MRFYKIVSVCFSPGITYHHLTGLGGHFSLIGTYGVWSGVVGKSALTFASWCYKVAISKVSSCRIAQRSLLEANGFF